MSIINALSVSIATLVLLPALANAQADTRPEALAANFMVQFYDVPADSVSVTLTEQTARQAKAKAEVAGGHVCIMEMALAPEGVHAPFGWLVGSMQCDQ
ncbi:hypothetical protein [Pseudomonas sp. 2FE]|uniref:hypothetical protein n=1 Tax=Pseudomonas sp. 2FE TaxID=2502190 RepID=UPI0010F4E6E9|nr:hypothetical protein [Pseudomonas sp. 2FE]